MQLLKVRGVLKANVPQNHFYKLKKHIGKTGREKLALAATVDDRNMYTVWPGCNIQHRPMHTRAFYSDCPKYGEEGILEI